MPSSDETNKYALTGWGTSLYDDLTMPSGQVAQVRKPGVQRLIAAGLLENADTLATIVDQKHIKRVKGKLQVDPASLLKDSANMMSVLEMVDKIVAHMVIQPSVRRPVHVDVDGPRNEKDELPTRPLRDEEREPGVVYTDQIEMIDRMFIFSYAVGGSTDVERFRGGLEKAMGSMEAGESVPLPAK